jgi:hypothetical protein
VDVRHGAVAAVAAVVERLLGRRPLLPIGASLKTLPQVKHVTRLGYEIVYRAFPASKRYQKWTFVARRNGWPLGRLDVDFIEAGRWLYVENICVEDNHGNKGLGAALLVCAAKTTACDVLTTSGRTAQGARFFDRMRPILQQCGVELRDRPPAGRAIVGPGPIPNCARIAVDLTAEIR